MLMAAWTSVEVGVGKNEEVLFKGERSCSESKNTVEGDTVGCPTCVDPVLRPASQPSEQCLLP